MASDRGALRNGHAPIFGSRPKFWNRSDDFFWDEQQSGFLPNKWVYAQMIQALST